MFATLGESSDKAACAASFVSAADPANSAFAAAYAASAFADATATSSDAANGNGACADATGYPTGHDAWHALSCSLPHAHGLAKRNVHGHGHAAYGHVDDPWNNHQ